MEPFVWQELILYIYPWILLIFVRQQDPSWRTLGRVRLSAADYLFPNWLVLIYGFGQRIYRLNVLPFFGYYLIILCLLHWWECLSQEETFSYQEYWDSLSPRLFLALTGVLFSLMILRLFTY